MIMTASYSLLGALILFFISQWISITSISFSVALRFFPLRNSSDKVLTVKHKYLFLKDKLFCHCLPQKRRKMPSLPGKIRKFNRKQLLKRHLWHYLRGVGGMPYNAAYLYCVLFNKLWDTVNHYCMGYKDD